jgi:hypothetical protein
MLVILLPPIDMAADEYVPEVLKLNDDAADKLPWLCV